MDNYNYFSISRLPGQKPYMGLLRCGVAPRTTHAEIDFFTTEYALLCIMEGSGKYIDYQGKEYLFSKGDLVQRFPSKPHTIYWHAGGASAHIAVPAEVFQLLKIGCNKTVFQTPVIENMDVSERFYQECLTIKTMLEELPPSRYIEIINHIQLFFSSILNSSNQDSLVTIIESLLTSHPEYRYTLADLAKHTSMSNSTFREKFTKEAGLSPGLFIIRKRIDYAKQLLLEQQLTVGEIAEKLNYPDIYTFSRQFKKFSNQTPSQFRNNPEL